MAASCGEGPDRSRPVVLVTGCSDGGIGHAVARAFAAAGCAVVATARSRGSMRDLKGDPRFLLLELDVRSDESARAAVADALREYGRIDVLVNNAGVHLVAPLAEVPMDSFNQVFDTNVYGKYCENWFVLLCLLSTTVFLCCLALLVSRDYDVVEGGQNFRSRNEIGH
jgi:NAD(P)-dependent dehydrogenase (short-subunit alcohol dehydrogenase family)